MILIKRNSDRIKLWLINLKRSILEWVINFVFSTSPLWLGAFALSTIDNSNNDLINSIFKNWPNMYSRGELFGYAMAALAPVIYIALKLRREDLYAGKATLLLLLSVILAIVSSATIAISLSSTSFNRVSTLPLSVMVFWISFALLFISIFINNQASPENQIDDAAKIIRSEGVSFSRRFQKED